MAEGRDTGEVTRRRLLGTSAAIGAAVMAPVPLRYALATSKPYKIGSVQSLSGGAASVGKTALVGLQMAVDRINKNGGVTSEEIGFPGPAIKTRA